MGEPPLEEPMDRQEKYRISDDEVFDRMIKKAFEEYPLKEGWLYDFCSSMDKQERKMFFVLELLKLIPSDDHNEPHVASIVKLFWTWREIRILKFYYFHKMKEYEAYPVCYGVVEHFYEEVIEPTEDDGEGFGGDMPDPPCPFDKMMMAISESFDEDNDYARRYAEFFVDFTKTCDELIERKKEALALWNTD